MSQIFVNRSIQPSPASTSDARAAGRIRALFALSPSFAVTPFVSLEGIAAELGIARLWAKDERARWNLGSFKALGGAYAVLTLAAEELTRAHAREISPEDIMRGRAPKAAHMTFAAATAGNHGRAVAFGAQLVGAKSVIFLYHGVPADQEAAIAGQGARIVHTTGNYEAAVRAAAARSAEQGWMLVADVAEPGYEDIPERVMRGYSVLIDEAFERAAQPPTHVFVQAGVGTLAAAMAGYLANCPQSPPRLIVVEAEAMPCLLESARQGRCVTIQSEQSTIMGRLACCAPSSTAWPFLRAAAAAFVAVDDASAAKATRVLVNAGITTSPTGAAGLAGLQVVSQNREARESLGLDAGSRVLIIITEQATAQDAQYFQKGDRA